MAGSPFWGVSPFLGRAEIYFSGKKKGPLPERQEGAFENAVGRQAIPSEKG